MKAKLLLALATISAIAFLPLAGQNNCCCETGENSGSGPYLTGELFLPSFTVDSTTYFNREWQLSDIVLSNGEIVRNRLIKYNRLLDEIIWLEPESKKIVRLDKKGIRQFHFLNLNGDTSIHFTKVTGRQNVISGPGEIFVQIIYEGKLSLYISHALVVDRKELISRNGITFEKEIYTEKPVYYLRSSDNKTFVTRSLSRKSLYAFSPGNKDKIKEFLKTNKRGKVSGNFYLVRLTQFLGTL